MRRGLKWGAVVCLGIGISYLFCVTGWWRHVVRIDDWHNDRAATQLRDLDDRIQEAVVDQLGKNAPARPSELLVYSCAPGRSRITLISYLISDEDMAGEKLKQLLAPQVDRWSIEKTSSDGKTVSTCSFRTGERHLSSVSSLYRFDTLVRRFQPSDRRPIFVVVPHATEVQKEGLVKVGQIKQGDVYILESSVSAAWIQTTLHFRFGQLLLAFAQFLTPLWLILIISGIGYLCSGKRADTRTRRTSYRLLTYPLTFIAFISMFSLAKVVSTNILLAFVPSSVVFQFFIGSVFFVPLSIVLAEFFLYEPVWTDNVSLSIKSSILYRGRFYCLGMFVGSWFIVMMGGNGSSGIGSILVPFLTTFVMSPFKATVVKDEVFIKIISDAANHFGIECKKAYLIVSGALAQMINAVAVNLGVILVTQRAYLEYTNAETKWLIAHECSHLRRMRDAKEPSPLLGFFGPVLVLGPLAVALNTLSYIALGVLVVGFFVFAMLRMRNRPNRSHETEFGCDADALAYTRDLASALSALDKLHITREKDKDSDSHPSIARRKENLVKVAEELGCGEPSGSGDSGG